VSGKPDPVKGKLFTVEEYLKSHHEQDCFEQLNRIPGFPTYRLVDCSPRCIAEQKIENAANPEPADLKKLVMDLIDTVDNDMISHKAWCKALHFGPCQCGYLKYTKLVEQIRGLK